MDQQNNARDRVYRFLDGVSQDENVATMVRMMIHTGEWQALTDYARKLGFPDSLDAEELRAHTDPENIIDNFVAFKNRCIAKEELRDKLEGSKFNAWFVGYVPWDEPRFAIAVLLDRTHLEGPDVAPVAARVAEIVGEVFGKWWAD